MTPHDIESAVAKAIADAGLDLLDEFLSYPGLTQLHLDCLQEVGVSTAARMRAGGLAVPRIVPAGQLYLPCPTGDPNNLFDEVRFDPRLAEFERKEREALARKLGYSGKVTTSSLYLGTLLNIVTV